MLCEQLTLEKLLEITVDNKLSFEPHFKKLQKNLAKKLHALARVPTHISQKKLRMIMRAFITLQSSYCPFVWMCHIRLLTIKSMKFMKRL